jgi:hypothetical protein
MQEGLVAEDIPRLFNSTAPEDVLTKAAVADPGLGALDPEQRHRGHTGKKLKVSVSVC